MACSGSHHINCKLYIRFIELADQRNCAAVHISQTPDEDGAFTVRDPVFGNSRVLNRAPNVRSSLLRGTAHYQAAFLSWN